MAHKFAYFKRDRDQHNSRLPNAGSRPGECETERGRKKDRDEEEITGSL